MESICWFKQLHVNNKQYNQLLQVNRPFVDHWKNDKERGWRNEFGTDSTKVYATWYYVHCGFFDASVSESTKWLNLIIIGISLSPSQCTAHAAQTKETYDRADQSKAKEYLQLHADEDAFQI